MKEDKYFDIEKRTEIRETARKLRRQFLRYQEAELVYSMTHRKLLEIAGKAGAIYRIDNTVLINRDIFNEYTVDYKIENHNGNWRSVDYLIFDGKQYFLMENQKYGKQSAAVILDQYGKLIADHCKNGFDEDAKRKIREISGLKERLE